MKFSIFALCLASLALSVESHPRHSDIIPKDYYKRQILQPIPGYIPVYIKADGEPVIRSESKKPHHVHSHKINEHKEKTLSEFSNKNAESSNDQLKSDIVSNKNQKVVDEFKNVQDSQTKVDTPAVELASQKTKI